MNTCGQVERLTKQCKDNEAGNENNVKEGQKENRPPTRSRSKTL